MSIVAQVGSRGDVFPPSTGEDAVTCGYLFFFHPRIQGGTATCGYLVFFHPSIRGRCSLVDMWCFSLPVSREVLSPVDTGALLSLTSAGALLF